MFKFSQLTTRIKLQLLEAVWRAALLNAVLIWISSDVSQAQIFTALCLVFLVLNFMVITKPLSYPINLGVLPEAAEDS
jgi:hypothetical protein